MPLGFDPEYFLNNPVERETRQAMMSGIQQLGQQVQQGIRAIATTRDLRTMGDELRTINPQSNDFAMRMVDVVTNHPLAIQDPRGVAAINLLGGAHKEWQAQQLRSISGPAFAPLAGGRGVLNRRTGDVSTVPEEAQPRVRPMKAGSGAIVDPFTGEELVPAPEPRPINVPRNSRLVDPRTGVIIVEPEERTLPLDRIPALRSRLLRDRKQLLEPLDKAITYARKLDLEANDPARRGQNQADPTTEAGKFRRDAEAAAARANAMQNDPFFQSQLQALDSGLMSLIEQERAVAPQTAPAPASAPVAAPMRWGRDANGNPIPLR